MRLVPTWLGLEPYFRQYIYCRVLIVQSGRPKRKLPQKAPQLLHRQTASRAPKHLSLSLSFFYSNWLHGIKTVSLSKSRRLLIILWAVIVLLVLKTYIEEKLIKRITSVIVLMCKNLSACFIKCLLRIVLKFNFFKTITSSVFNQPISKSNIFHVGYSAQSRLLCVKVTAEKWQA